LGIRPVRGIGKIPQNNTGKIYFNLGNEDVLKDGRKQYENGLGPDQILTNPRPLGRCSCFNR
jgi:cell surface protein SprA